MVLISSPAGRLIRRMEEPGHRYGKEDGHVVIRRVPGGPALSLSLCCAP